MVLISINVVLYSEKCLKIPWRTLLMTFNPLDLLCCKSTKKQNRKKDQHPGTLVFHMAPTDV